MNDSGPRRPWPAQRAPWVMRQTWHDLLFAHWPLPPEQLLPTLPSGLQLDTYEGNAWVGVVPFWMSGVRPRITPPIPGLSQFPELNVRTYVRGPRGEKPGVWFYSLDAANRIAVSVARYVFHLPYFRARMWTGWRAGWVHYDSERVHPGASAATLRGRFRPTGPAFVARPGSLDDWLTSRYALYAADGRARLYRLEIDHAPWPLQPAEAELRFDTLVAQHAIHLPDQPPLLHFAKRIDMVGWPLEPLQR